jgi:hypothetical protein
VIDILFIAVALLVTVIISAMQFGTDGRDRYGSDGNAASGS